MKVFELIEKLKTMPQNAEVWHLCDGAALSGIELIWFANSGQVVTEDYDEPCYNDVDRPESAPSFMLNPYWRTPKKPDEEIRME